jgi:hypothetical protein
MTSDSHRSNDTDYRNMVVTLLAARPLRSRISRPKPPRVRYVLTEAAGWGHFGGAHR